MDDIQLVRLGTIENTLRILGKGEVLDFPELDALQASPDPTRNLAVMVYTIGSTLHETFEALVDTRRRLEAAEAEIRRLTTARRWTPRV